MVTSKSMAIKNHQNQCVGMAKQISQTPISFHSRIINESSMRYPYISNHATQSRHWGSDTTELVDLLLSEAHAHLGGHLIVRQKVKIYWSIWWIMILNVFMSRLNEWQFVIELLCCILLIWMEIGDDSCVYMRSKLRRNRANMFSAFGLHRQVSW